MPEDVGYKNEIEGVDVNDRPDLYQAIWNQVMAIPEYGRTTYDKWLAGRFGDAVSDYFRSQSTVLGDGADRMGFGDFLNAAKAAGRGFGFGKKTALNSLGGISAYDLDRARAEYETDFAGSGITFDDIQEGAVRNALMKNFGGRGSAFALNDFFSADAISRFALDPTSQDGGFLSRRLADLRGRYGLQ